MKNGLPEFRVPGVRDLGQSLNESARFACHQLRYHFFSQACEQLRIARQQPAVEQRNRELYIVLVEPAAVLNGARRGTHSQARVPELLADGAHRVLCSIAQSLAFTEEEQVYVGMRV